MVRNMVRFLRRFPEHDFCVRVRSLETDILRHRVGDCLRVLHIFRLIDYLTSFATPRTLKEVGLLGHKRNRNIEFVPRYKQLLLAILFDQFQ
jgi:hypothetical protein